MAEQPEYSSEAMYNTIREALVRKGALLAACPACSHQQWGIAGTLMLPTVTARGTLGGSRSNPTGIEVALLTCTHCGFVQLHDITTLVA